MLRTVLRLGLLDDTPPGTTAGDQPKTDGSGAHRRQTDEPMGKVAVGAYLRRLRELRRMTQIDLAVELDVHESQIQRLESGRTSVGAALMLGAARLLGGELEVLTDLLLDRRASPGDGTGRTGRPPGTARRLADVRAPYGAAPDQEYAEVLERLRRDPRRLAAWLGYGHRLIDEAGEADARGRGVSGEE
jgi:transcriptional regulator with XRE-family HTH domain